jgi:hypothetical protein
MKILFLPHCLREDLKEEIRERVGDTYDIHVVPGGSRVKMIVDEAIERGEDIEKIVGIACGCEIKLANDYFKKIDFSQDKIFAVQLSKDGCKNTEVDLEDVWNVL